MQLELEFVHPIVVRMPILVGSNVFFIPRELHGALSSAVPDWRDEGALSDETGNNSDSVCDRYIGRLGVFVTCPPISSPG